MNASVSALITLVFIVAAITAYWVKPLPLIPESDPVASADLHLALADHLLAARYLNLAQAEGRIARCFLSNLDDYWDNPEYVRKIDEMSLFRQVTPLGIEWLEYDPPRSPSPSGMWNFVPEGHELYEEIAFQKGGSPNLWFSKLKAKIPYLQYAPPATEVEITTLAESIGKPLPDDLVALWRLTGGIKRDHDVVLLHPDEVIEFNNFYTSFLPDIMKDRFFIGGMDGYNQFMFIGGAVSKEVGEWDHEIDYTANRCENVFSMISEKVSGMATSWVPDCFVNGFVDRAKATNLKIEQ